MSSTKVEEENGRGRGGGRKQVKSVGKGRGGAAGMRGSRSTTEYAPQSFHSQARPTPGGPSQFSASAQARASTGASRRFSPDACLGFSIARLALLQLPSTVLFTPHLAHRRYLRYKILRSTCFPGEGKLHGWASIRGSFSSSSGYSRLWLVILSDLRSRRGKAGHSGKEPYTLPLLLGCQSVYSTI